MDWQLAIDINRKALLRILIALMASLGLVEGGICVALPRFLYARALFILRPAESALRRLIMIAAQELALMGVTLRSSRGALPDFSRFSASSADALPAFNLIDPLKNFGQAAPEFEDDGHLFNGDRVLTDKSPIPAAALIRRLLALKKALETIPAQSKRLARWYALRDLARSQHIPHRQSPMRPGLAPGSRRRKKHEIDTVLHECHLLAIDARQRRDSS